MHAGAHLPTLTSQGHTVFPEIGQCKSTEKEKTVLFKATQSAKCPLLIMEKAFCLLSLGHTQRCNCAHEAGIAVTTMWQQSQLLYIPSLVSLRIAYKLWNHCFFHWLGSNQFSDKAFILSSIKTRSRPFPETPLGGANKVLCLQLYKDLLCQLLGTKVETVSRRSCSSGLLLS